MNNDQSEGKTKRFGEQESRLWRWSSPFDGADRMILLSTRLLSVYIHRWYQAESLDLAAHDHCCDNLTIVLRGKITDENLGEDGRFRGRRVIERGGSCLRFYRQIHRITEIQSDTLTLWILGPLRQKEHRWMCGEKQVGTSAESTQPSCLPQEIPL